MTISATAIWFSGSNTTCGDDRRSSVAARAVSRTPAGSPQNAKRPAESVLVPACSWTTVAGCAAVLPRRFHVIVTFASIAGAPVVPSRTYPRRAVIGSRRSSGAQSRAKIVAFDGVASSAVVASPARITTVADGGRKCSESKRPCMTPSEYVPGGTRSIVKRPLASVRAENCVPSKNTRALGSGSIRVLSKTMPRTVDASVALSRRSPRATVSTTSPPSSRIAASCTRSGRVDTPPGIPSLRAASGPLSTRSGIRITHRCTIHAPVGIR